MANKKNNVDNNNEVLQENINNENSLKVNDLLVEKQQEIEDLKQLVEKLTKQNSELEHKNNVLKEDIEKTNKQQVKDIKGKAVVISTVNNIFNGAVFEGNKKKIKIASNENTIIKARNNNTIPVGMKKEDIVVVHMQSDKLVKELETICREKPNDATRAYLRNMKAVLFVNDVIEDA